MASAEVALRFKVGPLNETKNFCLNDIFVGLHLLAGHRSEVRRFVRECVVLKMGAPPFFAFWPTPTSLIDIDIDIDIYISRRMTANTPRRPYALTLTLTMNIREYFVNEKNDPMPKSSPQPPKSS